MVECPTISTSSAASKVQALPCSSDKLLSSRLSSANLPLNLTWKGIQAHSPVVLDGQPLARPPRLLGGSAPVVSLPGHELQAASHRLHGEAFNEHSPNEKAEVEFVNAVTAGGSVKFLPTV